MPIVERHENLINFAKEAAERNDKKRIPWHYFDSKGKELNMSGDDIYFTMHRCFDIFMVEFEWENGNVLTPDEVQQLRDYLTSKPNEQHNNPKSKDYDKVQIFWKLK